MGFRFRIALVCFAAGMALSCKSPEHGPPPQPTTAAAPSGSATPEPPKGPPSFHLESAAFALHTAIPMKHTCEGADLSPPLSWGDAPAGTKSFALIVDDPDVPDPAAPKRQWVHWVVYDIPASATGLPEGLKKTPEGARDGHNDWGKPGYGGPCPPIGNHRYYHKLYALDVVLGDKGPLTKAELEKAMEGHVLARVELVGLYQKQKPAPKK